MDVDNWVMFIGFFALLNEIKSFKCDIFKSSLLKSILYLTLTNVKRWHGKENYVREKIKQ